MLCSVVETAGALELPKTKLMPYFALVIASNHLPKVPQHLTLWTRSFFTAGAALCIVGC